MSCLNKFPNKVHGGVPDLTTDALTHTFRYMTKVNIDQNIFT